MVEERFDSFNTRRKLAPTANECLVRLIQMDFVSVDYPLIPDLLIAPIGSSLSLANWTIELKS